MSYDSNRAANVSGVTSPVFGTGWQANLFPTESNSTDPLTGYNDVTINESNGAQTEFFGNGASTTCTVPSDSSNPLDYTVTQDGNYPVLQDFCAPYRMDAQVGQFSNFYTVYAPHGGRSEITFNTLSGLPASVGNIDIPDLVSYLYNVTPGTSGCPTTSNFGTPVSCDIVQDSAGRKDVVTLGGPPTYPTATALVLQVSDPLGFTYGWDWVANWNFREPASIEMDDPSLVWRWGYNYTSFPTNLQTQMDATTNPDSDTQDIGYDGGGQVTSLTDFANADTTQYSYLNTSCTDECLTTSQGTTVNYPDGENDIDNYVEGLLTSNQFGTGTGMSLASVEYSYTYPSSQDQPITETIATENNAGNYPPWNITTDSVGHVINVAGPNGNDSSAQYEANDFDEPCWTAPVALPASPSCSSPPSFATLYAYTLFDGLLTSRTDPLGDTTNYGYYNDGALCWVQPPTVSGTGSACGVPYGSPTGAPAGANAVSYDTYGDITNQYVAYGTSSQTTQTASFDADGEKTISYPPDAYAEGTNPGSPNANFKTTNTYQDLRLKTVAAPLGRSTSYTYDGLGNQLTQSDPTGVTTDAYDADARLCWSFRGTAAVQNPPPCSTPPAHATGYYYNYDTTAVASETNPDGQTASYTYADLRFPLQPTEISDPQGVAKTFNSYDMGGNLCDTGPNNPGLYQCAVVSGDTQKTYDALGNLTSVVDPGGTTSEVYYYGYTTLPKSASQSINALGDFTDYYYDLNGNLTEEQSLNNLSQLVNTVQYGYDTDGRRCYVNVNTTSDSCTSVDNTSSNVMYSYDARGDLTSTTDYNGTQTTPTTTLSYDNNGALTQEIDDNGHTTNYAYDAAGDLTCVGYPVSASTNCNAAAGASNTIVDYGYDSAGRLQSTTDWLGNVTHYGYSTDGLSNLTGVTYPTSTGESLTYGYDSASILTSADYAGPAVGTQNQSFTPNADGLLSSTSQLNGYNSSPTYDGVNNWVAGNTNPGSSGPDAYGYNLNGGLQTDTPPSQSPTTYTYDAAQELTGVSNPNTGVTSTYAYTALGQRCWSVNQNVSNPSCSSLPTGATSYTWNSLGQLSCTVASTTNCSAPPQGGTSSSYTYDGLGLRTTATTTSNGAVWSAPSTVDGAANLSQVSCPSTSFCMAVDRSGNAVAEVQGSWGAPDNIDTYALEGVSCASSTFCMAVDSAGYWLTYNGSGWLKHSVYDSYQQPTAVSCVTNSFCVALDSGGRAYFYSSGTWTHNTADSVTEPYSLSCTATNFCMAIDLGGAAIKWTGGSWTRTTGVLPSWGLAISCYSSSYCAAAGLGGWANKYNAGAWSTAQQIDGSNFFSSVACPSSSACSATDDKGDLFTYSSGSWSATPQDIDGSLALSSITCSTPTVCEAVDQNGHVVNYRSVNQTAAFDWDLVSGGNLPRLVDDGTNAYIYGPTLFGDAAPIEQISLSSKVPSYLSSIPSGVQLAFASSGAMLNRSTYSTYGTPTSSSAPTSPFGYEGGYTDPTGLVYLNHRYFDPVSDEFLSVDPLVSQTGLPYQYADDNPLNSSDPNGMCQVTNRGSACDDALFAIWVIGTDKVQLANGTPLSFGQRWGYVGAGDYLAYNPVDLSQGNIYTVGNSICGCTLPPLTIQTEGPPTTEQDYTGGVTRTVTATAQGAIVTATLNGGDICSAGLAIGASYLTVLGGEMVINAVDVVAPENVAAAAFVAFVGVLFIGAGIIAGTSSAGYGPIYC